MSSPTTPEKLSPEKQEPVATSTPGPKEAEATQLEDSGFTSAYLAEAEKRQQAKEQIPIVDNEIRDITRLTELVSKMDPTKRYDEEVFEALMLERRWATGKDKQDSLVRWEKWVSAHEEETRWQIRLDEHHALARQEEEDMAAAMRKTSIDDQQQSNSTLTEVQQALEQLTKERQKLEKQRENDKRYWDAIQSNALEGHRASMREIEAARAQLNKDIAAFRAERSSRMSINQGTPGVQPQAQQSTAASTRPTTYPDNQPSTSRAPFVPPLPSTPQPPPPPTADVPMDQDLDESMESMPEEEAVNRFKAGAKIIADNIKMANEYLNKAGDVNLTSGQINEALKYLRAADRFIKDAQDAKKNADHWYSVITTKHGREDFNADYTLTVRTLALAPPTLLQIAEEWGLEEKFEPVAVSTKTRQNEITLAMPKKDAQRLNLDEYISATFNGDPDSPTKHADFAVFRQEWSVVETALKAMANPLPSVIFNKLRSCLTPNGPAWKLISQYQPNEPGSYNLALQKLEHEYGDPIKYMFELHAELASPEGTIKERAERTERILNTLEAREEVNKRENIDSKQFPAITAWYRTLTPFELSSWETYRHDFKQQQLRLGRSYKVGDCYTHQHIKAWADRVKHQVYDESEPPTSKQHADAKSNSNNLHAFTFKKPDFAALKKQIAEGRCVGCNGKGHDYQDCYKMLRMNDDQIRKFAKMRGICYRCGKVYHGMNCDRKCSICGYNHNENMCPSNAARKFVTDNQQTGQKRAAESSKPPPPKKSRHTSTDNDGLGPSNDDGFGKTRSRSKRGKPKAAESSTSGAFSPQQAAAAKEMLESMLQSFMDKKKKEEAETAEKNKKKSNKKDNN